MAEESCEDDLFCGVNKPFIPYNKHYPDQNQASDHEGQHIVTGLLLELKLERKRLTQLTLL